MSKTKRRRAKEKIINKNKGYEKRTERKEIKTKEKNERCKKV
ncbi:MAG: hypothetical protein AB7T10_06850 [bacterium]